MTIPRAEKSRILVVDDDQRVAALLSDLLNSEGYEVACAPNGQIGLGLSKTFRPDVVVSDVVMPVLNGIELCKRLKADPQTFPIPVLLISGQRNEPEDTLEGLSAGADDYLPIPFRNDELLVKVARLVERRRID